MATKIYAAPEELKVPSLGGLTSTNVNEKIKEHNEAEAKYRVDLKQWLTDNGYTGKNAGEIITFPVADSCAEYMVISMRPLQMFHLELGDAWGFQYADRLLAKDVQEKIDQKKAMSKLFGGRS